MDVTECLGLPYPECDPPITKDQSDIEQFRDLAEATDAAVQELADSITNLYLAPDAVSMFSATNMAGQDVLHFMSSNLFADPAAMSDTVADVIRIQETGWYLLGWSMTVSTAASVFLRAQPVVNGDTVSSLQGPGFSTGANEAVSGCDVLFLQAGDGVQLATHHAALPATVYTYNGQMWALRILVNV